MDGEATPALLAALLVALRMRGETVDELAGFATAMRERVLRVDAPDGAIDTVGTGGDGSGTFNISTTAALVVAAAGVPVAKHGNRAMTSRVRLGRRPRRARRPDRPRRAIGGAPRCATSGFAFMFAPGFHPAMKHAGPDPPRDRRPDGVQPARPADEPGRDARRQLIGVADPARPPSGGRRRSRGSARSGRSSSTATASTSCRSTAPASSTT